MFANARSFVDSATDAGRHWISSYRKQVSTSATVAGQWYDYGYAGGNPIPNYYASAPLEAAVLDSAKGIVIPRLSGTQRLYVHRWSAMSAAASTASVTNANQSLFLLDYLLYYPFVDMDAAGDVQSMTQTVPLSRYTDGVGVQMIVVAQSPTVGGGRFAITYTDSDDVQQVTTSMFCGAAQPAGAIVNAVGAVGGLTPFVPLNAGVRGVKRVDSVTFTVANGGLCAVVLVKPLMTMWLREGCRTPGESFGDVAEHESMRTRAGLPEVKSGAFLGIMGRGANGSLASSVLAGTVETVWSE